MSDKKEIIEKIVNTEKLVKDLHSALIAKGTPQKALESIMYFSYMIGAGKWK